MTLPAIHLTKTLKIDLPHDPHTPVTDIANLCSWLLYSQQIENGNLDVHQLMSNENTVYIHNGLLFT